MDRTETTRLLEDAKGGSDAAMNALLDRCAGRLLALIRLRMGSELRSRVESRDVLNATLLKAFRSIDRFEKSDSRSLMAWLASIARNEIRDQRDFHRRGRRDVVRAVDLEPALDALAARVTGQLNRLLFDERMSRLERALEELDEPYREVIVLRKLEELSYAEIGNRMGRSPDACRMLLARAMTALTLKTRESR